LKTKILTTIVASIVLAIVSMLSGCTQTPASQTLNSTPVQQSTVSTPTVAAPSPTPQVVYRDQTYNCLSPRGIQLPVEIKPLATRLDTMDGKTIYVVQGKQTQSLCQPYIQLCRKLILRPPGIITSHRLGSGRLR
jgi:hypothetical protein